MGPYAMITHFYTDNEFQMNDKQLNSYQSLQKQTELYASPQKPTVNDNHIIWQFELAHTHKQCSEFPIEFGWQRFKWNSQLDVVR